MSDPTPMMKQYRQVKSEVPDALLFFRLGDFYEMFGEDALVASKELEITLTGRGQGENRAPMCGVPYHSVTPYISKLISKGYKVAICEQVEDPDLAEGLVKREVIKIITPGTVLDTAMLSEKESNYLMALSFSSGRTGLSYIDISTGEFKALDIEGDVGMKVLYDEIERVSPAEVIISRDVFENDKKLVSFLKSKNIVITPYNLKDIFDAALAKEKVLKHFKLESLDGFGFKGDELSLCAVSPVIDYLKETQKTSLSHVNSIKKYRIDNFMYIDTSTRRNLELVQTIKERSFEGSLLWMLDRTKTPMGSRLLRSWVLSPLCDKKQIDARLEAVEELTKSSILRQELEGTLDDIRDIERLTGKIASASANARDLVALKESLLRLPKVKELLSGCFSRLIKEMTGFGDLSGIASLIEASIVDDPPFVIKDGGLIKKGYSAELDEIIEASTQGKEWISRLEETERQRTGIKSLKVGFTKVFGYYIEVSATNQKYVPMDYIRKQTLVNCERYITPELKEKESMILNAQERVVETEYSLFCTIRDRIAGSSKELQAVSLCIASLDALLALANTAVGEGYFKPEITSGGELMIKEGRHPVAEKTIGHHLFVPNDTRMDELSRFLLITGPNMAGKSTYMKQIALIALLAQIGSFVPAKSAKIPVIDRIFTRVGALDDIYAGQSTFMVEMLEAANILNNATENSLIILDEIGRGTATFDGMSIACAVSEFIHTKIKAKTLFATHYHEITQLAEKYPGMKNLNVAVKEEGDHITFLHKILEGPSDKSYGIQVAKLAGLPDEVIKRAKEVYEKLEMVESDFGKI
ncbi:MAG: DNA mismatch repair protein MutS [Candidatus Saganbacteria bacterium]|nr:DNA mismatch repair protein MutS [Candidatus Saganbacteria bacterium]